MIRVDIKKKNEFFPDENVRSKSEVLTPRKYSFSDRSPHSDFLNDEQTVLIENLDVPSSKSRTVETFHPDPSIWSIIWTPYDMVQYGQYHMEHFYRLS